jgi:hypothetical protein
MSSAPIAAVGGATSTSGTAFGVSRPARVSSPSAPFAEWLARYRLGALTDLSKPTAASSIVPTASGSSAGAASPVVGSSHSDEICDDGPGVTLAPSPVDEPASSGESANSTPYADLFTRIGQQVGVDPALLAAVAKVESNFNPRAVSKAGAKGLMQLMGPTAASLGVTDPFDAEQNVRGGARFLRYLLDKYHGSTTLALAAYNAGPGSVDRYGGVPPFAETKVYLPRVMAALEKYRQLDWS